MTRPLVAQVDLAALKANVARVRQYAPAAKVMAVVKANAYGHHLERVLPALDDADGLALLELDAALGLRRRGEARPLVLLEGCFDARELPEVAAGGIDTVVHSPWQLAMLREARLARRIGVHVKVNTGMNRLGFAPAEVHGVCDELAKLPGVEIRTVMTHFARADEDGALEAPLARFAAACRGLAWPRSLANSAGTVRYAEVGGEWVRPGIMLYGATPFAGRSAASLGLVPAMTLRSRLIAVQSLAAGESVGYGAMFTARAPARIGIVACGYADGYPRHAPNGTPVLVCGRRARTAGRVSMDMLAVDLAGIPEADVGSDVVLWGGGLPVDEVAVAAGTVGYELLCAVAPRVAFETVAAAAAHA
ncbi:MAG: alanine racemase [Proteobacteria bacterium]|nr:alanine racemase [Pseudomonadota bacterium]